MGLALVQLLFALLFSVCNPYVALGFVGLTGLCNGTVGLSPEIVSNTDIEGDCSVKVPTVFDACCCVDTLDRDRSRGQGDSYARWDEVGSVLGETKQNMNVI